MTDDKAYKAAKQKLEEIKGYFIHLGVYVIVNLGIFTLNMIVSPDHLWFYWVLIGWGIGLAIHTLVFILETYIFGTEWEEKQIQKILSSKK